MRGGWLTPAAIGLVDLGSQDSLSSPAYVPCTILFIVLSILWVTQSELWPVSVLTPLVDFCIDIDEKVPWRGSTHCHCYRPFWEEG